MACRSGEQLGIPISAHLEKGGAYWRRALIKKNSKGGGRLLEKGRYLFLRNWEETFGPKISKNLRNFLTYFARFLIKKMSGHFYKKQGAKISKF